MNTQQLIAYPQGTTEPLTYPTGEVILDLFKDEPIPLTLNVDDFTNVAEADASYSKSFDIPGTKKNNLFFNHIYDITSDSNFNPHIKTKIIVKEGSFNTFEGYLQLNDIVIKDDAITYDITLYSEAVNLKDTIGSKVFRDLDLSELDHLYDGANIENSWTGILDLFTALPANSFAGSGTTTDVLKYPFVNWTGYYSYPSGDLMHYASDTFRPFINALYLLKNIFRDAGYTFSSTFLNSVKFNKLYVDFNTTSSDAIFGGDAVTLIDGTYNTTSTVINATSVSGGSAGLFDISTDVLTAVNNGTTIQLQMLIDMVSSSNSMEISCHHTNTSYAANPVSGSVLFSSAVPNSTISNSFGNWIINSGESIWLEIRALSGTVTIDTAAGTSHSVIFSAISSTSISLNNILLGYRGDTEQWDFLKGFVDMFKLVILIDENNPTNLIIEPYKDWVDTGNLLDFTNKIDDTDIKYSPIDGLAKNILLNFEEDGDDWITPNLNNPSTSYYGYNYTSNIEIIDKDTEDIVVNAFSDTYVKDFDTSAGSIMPQIMDSSVGPAGQSLRYWENNMRILYDNGVHTLNGITYSTYGGEFTNESDYLLFSAVDEFPITATSNSIRFNTIAEEYSPNIILNNLFNIYWFKYIDELYHKDTRIVKLVAYLTAKDIYELNFNDIILIKNKKFRIHKIEYRAGAMSKLELITIKDL
tara:strand:- start:866 stop:2956 length:2091 start_codon:yes stop_codon:yes gene_type:complete